MPSTRQFAEPQAASPERDTSTMGRDDDASAPQAQSGDVHTVDGLVDLASDASGEKVAARVGRECGRRNEVAFELEREPVVCPIPLRSRQLRRRLELSIERRIV